MGHRPCWVVLGVGDLGGVQESPDQKGCPRTVKSQPVEEVGAGLVGEGASLVGRACAPRPALGGTSGTVLLSG